MKATDTTQEVVDRRIYAKVIDNTWHVVDTSISVTVTLTDNNREIVERWTYMTVLHITLELLSYFRHGGIFM